jgi:desulfoferrodoxin-like iron-binding protein
LLSSINTTIEIVRNLRGPKEMTVESIGEKYRCNICGNEITVTKVGGGTLVCCGEDMEKIESAGS